MAIRQWTGQTRELKIYIFYLESIRPIRTAENFEASNGRLASPTKTAALWD